MSRQQLEPPSHQELGLLLREDVQNQHPGQLESTAGYKCKECGKGFTRGLYLVAHMNICRWEGRGVSDTQFQGKVHGTKSVSGKGYSRLGSM